MEPTGVEFTEDDLALLAEVKGVASRVGMPLRAALEMAFLAWLRQHPPPVCDGVPGQACAIPHILK